MTDFKSTTLSASEAAQFLSEQLGGAVGQWEIWLANERRPNRVNRLLERIPGPGRPRYSEEALKSFVPVYGAKHESKERTTTKAGRKVAVLGAHAYAHTEPESPYESCVLFVTVNPLKTSKMTSAEARQLARKLITAADEVDASFAAQEDGSK